MKDWCLQLNVCIFIIQATYQCIKCSLVNSTNSHNSQWLWLNVESFCVNSTNFLRLSSRAHLSQLLIVTRSLTTLCDQNRSKTRPIAIMNLTAKLAIIYATLHNCVGLSEYQLSGAAHCTVLTTKQTLYEETGKVGSSKSVAAETCWGSCSVLCSRHLLLA